MSQDIRQVLANNVKLLRTQKNLSREELSLALGVDNSYISKLEKGKINITLDKIEMLAIYFETDVYLLLKEIY
jgi:transcriptional regulator with XRE-family HTH domain